jgi:hypothetical protein
MTQQVQPDRYAVELVISGLLFALLTDRKIRPGIYRSVAALRADITSFIDRHNADPKPSRWTKSADDILASIERFCRYNAPAKHDPMSRTSGSGH